MRVAPVRTAPPPNPEPNPEPNLEQQRRVDQREKILVRTFAIEDEVIDLTDTLVSAIAHKLWELYDGDEKLNWLEAEMLLHEVLRRYHGLWTQKAAVKPGSTGTRPSY